MKDLNAIIDTLGGTSKAAEVFGVTMQAVSNWKADGRFPRSRRYDALMILQARGIEADPMVFSDTTAA